MSAGLEQVNDVNVPEVVFVSLNQSREVLFLHFNSERQKLFVIELAVLRLRA